MRLSLKPFLSRWRLCALLASAVLLAAAHAFETFAHLAPCPLCLRQREIHWAVLALAAVSMAVVRLPGGPRWREASNWLLTAMLLLSAGVAGFHAGVEWKFWPGPTTCAGAGGVDAGALSALIAGAPVAAARCDEAAWVFAGLSMAGWNAVISLALAVMSGRAALYERARR